MRGRCKSRRQSFSLTSCYVKGKKKNSKGKRKKERISPKNSGVSCLLNTLLSHSLMVSHSHCTEIHQRRRPPAHTSFYPKLERRAALAASFTCERRGFGAHGKKSQREKQETYKKKNARRGRGNAHRCAYRHPVHTSWPFSPSLMMEHAATGREGRACTGGIHSNASGPLLHRR